MMRDRHERGAANACPVKLFTGRKQHFPVQRRKMHGGKCSDKTGRTESDRQVFV